uniref:Bowman-Birk serine protease inhibitors family domain-containing protein n=1 Tax=Leersia perrieri TaxID=77586 RepID=A0A0D9XKH1_9ORYZ
MAMANNPKNCVISHLVAVLLIVITIQSQAWAVVDDDMMPVTPARPVMVSIITGGVGTAAAAPVCLQCRCCSRTNPSNCQITSCCSSFNCDPSGKCNLVQKRCGCDGGC